MQAVTPVLHRETVVDGYVVGANNLDAVLSGAVNTNTAKHNVLAHHVVIAGEVNCEEESG